MPDDPRALARALMAALEAWLRATEPRPDLPLILTRELGGHIMTETDTLILLE